MSARVRTRPRRPLAALAAVGLGLTLLLSGCGISTDLYHMPLPGGADVGDHPVKITADFTDVVDLVPQSSVKVENIAVGRVSSIDLNPDGRTARVTLLVRRSVDLPQGTTARLQQTSLLGEKYVALIRPKDVAPGTPSLQSGADISVSHTSQVAEIEQVMGALSLVINGGGIEKFDEISRELQKVSTGRSGEVRAFLRNMGAFVTSLDARKGALTDAIDAMAKLSKTLDGDKAKIATALDGLSPGMQVLVKQRKQLVSMLTSLDKLSTVSVRTLNASQKDMVEDMKLLEPILNQLAASGRALPDSLELLLTYPFPDSVLNAIRGDYLNTFVTANYTSLPDSCAGFGCPWPQLPDNGSEPAIDPSFTSNTNTLAKGLTAKDLGLEKPEASGSASAGASPSGGASTGSTTGASSSPSANSSAKPGASSSPSPSLLPPTDSALPGLGQPSVQVTNPGSGGSSSPGAGEGN